MSRRSSAVSRRRFLQSTALGAAAAAGVLNAPAVLRAQGAAVKVGVLHPVSGALSYSGQQGRLGAGDFDELIRTLQQTLGLTVYMVTHDLDSLNEICDRIAVLSGGKVIVTGTMATMLECEHPWVKEYFRGKRARAIGAARAHA